MIWTNLCKNKFLRTNAILHVMIDCAPKMDKFLLTFSKDLPKLTWNSKNIFLKLLNLKSLTHDVEWKSTLSGVFIRLRKSLFSRILWAIYGQNFVIPQSALNCLWVMIFEEIYFSKGSTHPILAKIDFSKNQLLNS